MADCNAWTYTKVTPDVFKALRARGKKQDVIIPNASKGSFTVQAVGMSIWFRYTWNQPRATLNVQCVSRPLLVGCSTIKKMADQIIISSGGQSA